MDTTLDPQLVNLAKAIRQTESQGNFQARGVSGEYGGYQFMPSTWNATAPKFGVNVPLEQATPEQQNEVAYKQLAEWKQEHPDWNVGNFASAWNAGPGRPNAYLEGNAGTNEYGAKYDTAAYAKSVAEAYQGFKTNTLGNPADQVQTTAQENPSFGGFAHNALQSGAGLLANVGEAVLHPIQTVQNIGGAAVGGLEKVAGQENENTQKFDNVVNFFKNRYGSVQNLEKTLYEDPVGVAADLSSLLGVGGTALNIGGKVSKINELSRAGSTLNKASELTNPLAPIVAGVSKTVNPVKNAVSENIGKLAGIEPGTIEAIRNNPESFTPNQIASVTRQAVASEVEDAIKTRLSKLDELGGEYSPLREVGKVNNSFSAETLVPVSPSFLEDQFAKAAGVAIKDGQVEATGSSIVRNATDLGKLQKTYDLWAPTFKKGVLTPNEFLNFRDDLAELAKFGLGEKKSTPLQDASKGIRANLNKEYRDKIPGLKELDEQFSKERREFDTLRKGLFDKNGNPNDTMINLVANAANKGNVERLARLEKLLPGITKKLEILKAIEDIQKAMGTKAGTYNRSLFEAGGLVGGAATGNVGVLAVGLTAAIVSDPANAVRIIRAAEAINPRLVNAVLGRLARYATIGSVAERATQTGSSQPQSEETTAQTEGSQASPDGQSPQSQPQVQTTLDKLAKDKNFNLQGARDAGYSDEEILNYLQTNQ